MCCWRKTERSSRVKTDLLKVYGDFAGSPETSVSADTSPKCNKKNVNVTSFHASSYNTARNNRTGSVWGHRHLPEVSHYRVNECQWAKSTPAIARGSTAGARASRGGGEAAPSRRGDAARCKPHTSDECKRVGEEISPPFLPTTPIIEYSRRSGYNRISGCVPPSEN